jgi:hypothetical protein
MGQRPQKHVLESKIQNTGSVGFEVFTAVAMKNSVFWDVALLLALELYPKNMNRKVGYCLSKSCKSLIYSLKKPPEHDVGSTRLRRSTHARQL